MLGSRVSKAIHSLLLIAALALAQHAAMLHGLVHAEHDLALATHPDGKVPPLGHGLNVCAAFDALAHAVGNAPVALPGASVQARARTASFRVVLLAPRIVFDSRAPPALS